MCQAKIFPFIELFFKVCKRGFRFKKNTRKIKVLDLSEKILQAYRHFSFLRLKRIHSLFGIINFSAFSIV